MDVEVAVGMGQKPPALPPGDRFQGHLLRQLVEGGQRAAEQANQPEVKDAHLLCALVENADPPTRELMERCNLRLDTLRAELQQSAREDMVLIDRPVIGKEASATLNEAVREAEEDGQAAAGARHMLLAILASVTVTELLHRLNVAVERLKYEARARPHPRLKQAEQEQ
jgi:ATP-dependent Clp protease ATP-binding subunit ClpA